MDKKKTAAATAGVVVGLGAARLVDFLLIGGSQSEDAGGDSDDLQSWGYFNRAKEIYKLLGVPERLQFCSTDQGHHANGVGCECHRHQFSQATHGPDVLLFTTAMDGRAGAHEQQRLEKGVRNKMEHPDRHSAHAQPHHHEAQL